MTLQYNILYQLLRSTRDENYARKKVDLGSSFQDFKEANRGPKLSTQVLLFTSVYSVVTRSEREKITRQEIFFGDLVGSEARSECDLLYQLPPDLV